MIRINIKPLSVNEAWQGRRFKTKKYTQYQNNLFLILPKMVIPKGKLEIRFVFGLCSQSDIDNPLKLLIDIFQKKYNFNDKNVMRLIVEKRVVKSGQEYFEFEINQYG